MAPHKSPYTSERRPRWLARAHDDGTAEAVLDREAALDQTVLDSFPASDPAAPGVPRERERRENEAAGAVHQQAALDGALEDTFPASDPVSLAQPGGRKRQASS
ncbi:MAG: hypothetical protein KF813_02345 [Trueperaceae bacterium]|nr:hypothetical protein [Trueperaceae bacterium]